MIISISQTEKLRPREAKGLAQGLTAKKWQVWSITPAGTLKWPCSLTGLLASLLLTPVVRTCGFAGLQNHGSLTWYRLLHPTYPHTVCEQRFLQPDGSVNTQPAQGRRWRRLQDLHRPLPGVAMASMSNSHTVGWGTEKVLPAAEKQATSELCVPLAGCNPFSPLNHTCKCAELTTPGSSCPS